MKTNIMSIKDSEEELKKLQGEYIKRGNYVFMRLPAVDIPFPELFPKETVTDRDMAMGMALMAAKNLKPKQ